MNVVMVSCHQIGEHFALLETVQMEESVIPDQRFQDLIHSVIPGGVVEVEIRIVIVVSPRIIAWKETAMWGDSHKPPF